MSEFPKLKLLVSIITPRYLESEYCKTEVEAFFTTDSINHQSGVPGSDAVFELLNSNGYDFYSGKNYSGKSTYLNSGTIAVNLKFNACYKFDHEGRVALKFGINATIAPLLNSSKQYVLIDKSTDPYNTIFNGQSKSKYSFLNLYSGFIYQF